MGGSCSFGLPIVLFVFLLIVILVLYHFGFEGETLVLIASVPGHCLSFTVAIVCSHVVDCNARNRCLTAKHLKQGYRHHKLRKAFF